MKTVELKTQQEEIHVAGKKQLVQLSTAELIIMAINCPKQGGFTIDDMTERLRIKDALDKNTDEQVLTLEDNDFKNLSKLVKECRWNFISGFTLEFINSFKVILLILLCSFSVLCQGQDTLLMKNGKTVPIFNVAPVENPAGLSFFSTYLRRLALDSITSLGFASYGNSVSGPYSSSLNTLLRKHFYYYMTTYPSSFNSGLIITQKVVRASYSDSTINQSTSIGTPSNFTYISSGDHVVLNNNDSLAGNVGVQTGFDMARFIFAKTPTSGTAVVTVRDAIADTVVRTQTINLFSADTIAYGKVDFTGLPEFLRYKFSVRATADSVFLLKVVFMYSKGLTPLQLGRGGSTLAQNNYANRAIMKGIIDDFNVRLIIVSCKEEAPRTSYPALRDSMNKYIGVSKLMIGSLPDSGPADTQIVYNNIARSTLLPAGWAYIDAYRAFGGYSGLSSIGAQGDGVHPPNSPYDVIIGRVSSQAGWNTLSQVYKGNIDNISDVATSYGKFGELYIQTAGTGNLETRKTLALQSAGGGASGKINALNLNGVYFGNSSTYAGIGATSSTRVTTLNSAEMQAQAYLVTSSSAQSIFGSVRIQTATAHVAAGAAQFVYRHTDGNIRTRQFATGIQYVLLEAGGASAGQAPLKFTSGTNLTVLENGAVEYDGTHFYGTVGGVRKVLEEQGGTYTPTLTGTANVSSISIGHVSWHQARDRVFVTGTINITPTAATTTTSFYMSLPVASLFDAASDCGGTFSVATGATGGLVVGTDQTNDAASFNYVSVTNTATVLGFTFSYIKK